MSHTPGPWTVRKLPIGEHPYDYYITTPSGALGYLGTLEKHDDDRMRYAPADAALIAAAPDLLAALKKIANVDDGELSGIACVEIAQAAIAKAEGR